MDLLNIRSGLARGNRGNPKLNSKFLNTKEGVSLVQMYNKSLLCMYPESELFVIYYF
jgi:hypothetical protein